MTIAVSQQQADAGDRAIAFYMPSETMYEVAPKPKGGRAHIHVIAAR